MLTKKCPQSVLQRAFQHFNCYNKLNFVINSREVCGFFLGFAVGIAVG